MASIGGPSKNYKFDPSDLGGSSFLQLLLSTAKTVRAIPEYENLEGTIPTDAPLPSIEITTGPVYEGPIKCKEENCPNSVRPIDEFYPFCSWDCRDWYQQVHPE